MTELTLDNAGAFTGSLIKKSITWTMGGEEHTATVYVRPLSYQAAIADLNALRDQDGATAARISCSICNAKGERIFPTPGHITGEADPVRGPLDGGLTIALLIAIGEVNKLGKKKTLVSKKKSGTN